MPEPEIEIMSGGICVTLFKDIYNEKHLKSLNLNDRQLKAVLYVKENRKITNKEYQKLFSVSLETATRDLTDLANKKILISSGSKGAGSFYTIIAT